MKTWMSSTAIALLTLVAGCGDDDGGRSEDTDAASASEQASSTTDVTLELVHHFRSNDGSGITRTGGNDSRCVAGFYEGSPIDDSGALDFMTPDADVVLRDADGTITATSALGDGTVSKLVDEATITFDCTWTVDLADVTPSRFYEIEVEGSRLATVDAERIDAPIDVTP